MSDTATVYHPTIAKVSNEIPKGDLQKWVDQGWLKTEPKVSREADADAVE
jgi:hypothetical protein